MIKSFLFLLVSLSFMLVACKEPVLEQIDARRKVVQTTDKLDKIFEARVRSSLGKIELLRAKGDTWKLLRVGQSVFGNDRVRTFAESEVLLATFDGSVFLISEKTDVEFNTDLQNSVRGDVNMFLRNGNIQFDVQKQKKNQFSIKTGTATASIRGTAGFVGSLDGLLVASLKEGLVDVTGVDGKVTSITENQTVLMTKSGEAKTFKLESSGTSALYEVLNEMAVSGSLENMESLEKSLQDFDSGYVAKKNVFQENLTFEPVSIPAKISSSSVTLKAKLTPGVFVTVMGITDSVPASGDYERTFTWGERALGTKRFIAICSDGAVEVACNIWNTEYVTRDELDSAVETSKDSLVSSAEQEVPLADTASKDSAVAASPKFLSLAIDLPPLKGGEVLERDAFGRDTLEIIRNVEGNEFVEIEQKIMLYGIARGETAKIDTIFIFRKGKTEDIITDIKELSYTRKFVFRKDEVSKFEVAAKLKDGTYVVGFKTYVID